MTHIKDLRIEVNSNPIMTHAPFLFLDGHMLEGSVLLSKMRVYISDNFRN